MIRLGLLIAGLTVAALPLAAQSDVPRFEVVSVKPAPPPQASNSITVVADAPGSFNRTATVAFLIQFAYDLQDRELVGGPSWVRADRFDVAARAGRPVPVEELRLMVRSLLAERFKLVAHTEQRDLPYYTLLLARTDKQLGPRLKKSDDGCTGPSKPVIDMPPRAATASGCGEMTTFIRGASRQMDAPVTDGTGLVGKFQWSYYYDGAGGPLARLQRPVAADPNMPQYATALQEQLGLKLEPRRGPTPVIVIDSIDRPTPN
jgi:uncharacterized protein (TIGR03435 family)